MPHPFRFFLRKGWESTNLRVPQGRGPHGQVLVGVGWRILASETWEGTLYHRHEGGLLSRALGSAVHALLEELARLRAGNDWNAARAALARFEPRITAQVRASGVEPAQAARIAAQALESALSRFPFAPWPMDSLAPRPKPPAR